MLNICKISFKKSCTLKYTILQLNEIRRTNIRKTNGVSMSPSPRTQLSLPLTPPACNQVKFSS